MFTTYLDDSLLSLDLNDLSFSHDTVAESNVDNLGISWELDVVEDDQRPLNIKDCSVINSWSDVVVGGNRFNVVLDADTHFLFLILYLIKCTLLL